MFAAGDDEEDEEIVIVVLTEKVFSEMKEEVEEEGVVDYLISRVTSRTKPFLN